MWHVRFLGGWSVEHAGAPLRVSSRKAAALFALLAIRPGQPVPRGTLAALLWPDSGEAAARASLR